MSICRPPAVAGTFYPADPVELKDLVNQQLCQAESPQPRAPIALIVPHAGLIYSGPVAASAYRQLESSLPTIDTVAIFGPSHRVPLRGMAVPRSQQFATPLGSMPLADDVLGRLAQLDQVVFSEAAHQDEHSLEVQLPFLQALMPDARLAPVVVGQCDPELVAQAMASALQRQPEDSTRTLLVVSTDLSHFHSYAVAQELDGATCDRIAARATDIRGEQACGCQAINGLMQLARRQQWEIELLKRCNSGDTAGPRDRVVGYGAFALYDA